MPPTAVTYGSLAGWSTVNVLGAFGQSKAPLSPEAAKKLHAAWWEARIARQKEIDASIAAKAEYEFLYDKP